MSATALVTGASGLLGRAVLSAFDSAPGFRAVGTCFSRATGLNLVKCDLTDASSIARVIDSVAPRVIIHCAAERRPDACEKNPLSASAINVHAVYALARAADAIGATFIFISTDYLFDGRSAPYSETAPTCPLNAYGAQKVRGEAAAIAGHAHASILRVPVLYGPCSDLRESAVTAFAAILLDNERASVDDWQIRVPTRTTDIAETLVNMARASIADGGAARVAGVWHYSGAQRFTRYELVRVFGQMLGRSIENVARVEGAPPGAPRPYDCQLDTSKLDATGWAAPHADFKTAVRAIIEAHETAQTPEGRF